MTWICLIENDLETTDAITAALRDAGHGVRSFRDGSEALEAIETALEPPRFVILDVLLRLMSGLEVVRRLRTGKRVPRVPVLVITGVDVDETYFAPWPVLAVMRKPIVMDALLAKVEEGLAATRRGRKKKPPKG